jgi:hypothetical protein
LILAFSIANTGCALLNSAGATQPIAISASLPVATLGHTYSAAIAVSGGTAPYNFTTKMGQLPPGLTMSAHSGSISGTPKTAGAYKFTIFVADQAGNAAGTQRFSITVKAPVVTPSVEVAVSPTSVNLAPGAAHQFSAVVSNASNPAVTWSVSAGTITSMGLFIAPIANTSATIQLTATSKADPSKQGAATITVSPSTQSSSTLAVSSTSLPEATEGVPYNVALHASGGKAPFQWKVASGSLPSGIELAADGTIQGLALQAGISSFTASVSDASSQSVSHKFSINVSPSNISDFDGSAELPRVYVKSSLADTPAPGVTHAVTASAGLQPTLNSAKCGDTITLKAGATFTGTFTLPAKKCDDNHWIIVRTSAPDSALPPEGNRLTPCYAGVASLPGRPPYSCPSPRNVLSAIVFSGEGSGPIVFANGANHYRFLGVEITRNTPRAVVYNLVLNDKDGTADHIVFDRSWIHGTAQDETTRGIMLSGTTYAAIVDSYMSDFHCVAASGACGDAQAIAGGLGSNPMGPYKIDNNFMEGAAETIIFGGGAATVAPTDIEVRHNHMFKPANWMKGSPNFVGGRDGHPFIVKNLFELKNAQRVLLEGNILENTWGGFSQVGFAILLTPKNQASGTGNVCPACLVTDVTIRYNLVRNTASGMQIANAMSDNKGAPLDGQRYSIHDVIFEGLDGTTYSGAGVLAQVSASGDAPILQHVKIDHVTALSLRTLLVVGDNLGANPKMSDFTFTNNIANAGVYPFLTADGGKQDCVYGLSSPSAVLNSCFSNYHFSNNAIIGLPKSTPPSTWPTGNSFPATSANILFTSDNPIDGNYQLLPASPFISAGTDGKDLGADVAAVTAAIAGIE